VAFAEGAIDIKNSDVDQQGSLAMVCQIKNKATKKAVLSLAMTIK
jgi:hypothetical protein